MKKVLFIASLYYPHVGGIETMITELSRFYRSQGIDSVVLTKKWPTTLPSHSQYDGIEIYRVISARKKEEFFELINWLKRNNLKIKADIVHIIGIRRPLPLAGLMLGRLWNVPVISTVAGGEIPDKYDPQPGIVWEEGRELIPNVLRQSDNVNCVSKYLSRDLKEIMPDIKKNSTLYAGIDFSIINKTKPKKIKEQYILSLRRLDPSKGIDILIKAYNLIKNKFPDLYLVILGEGPEEQRLKKIVARYHLSKRVIFTGTIKFKRSISFLKGAILTVVPSLSEGGGLVNIEAQAAGCPVIASRVGGIPEYVKDGKSGILFKSGDYRELAEKISQLINDTKLRKKIINGGYKHAKSFDWNALAPQYISLYVKNINRYKSSSIFKPWSSLTIDLWNKLINNTLTMEKIIKSLKNYDLKEISPINILRESDDNEVFAIGKKDKKIFRISKRLPIDDIKFEYEAIKFLCDNGIRVPKLLETRTGNFYTLVNGKVAVLFDFLNGKHTNVNKYHLPDKIQVYNAGESLGFMSNVASKFTSFPPRKRNIFSELERANKLSNIFINQFEGGKEFVNQIREAIKFGKSQKEITGLIHNDYRPSNVLFDNKNKLVGIVDFDWSCIGPLVKDLALAVVEWSFADGATEPDFRIFNSFLKGYNSVAIHKWTRSEKLYSWIKFATLSDASTYFCDLANSPDSSKRIEKSYMYQKYLFFSKI